MATVAETIRLITRKHLVEDNGLLFAQCVAAVGWIGGTVPDDIPDNNGIVELPTSDVSNSGIVVGAALVGRRPIYVIRYQGFVWYNACTLVNYAAKSKELWDVPCPVFIRSLGMEGSVGPVASNMHHGMIMRMPGIVVAAPMTPREWKEVWDYYSNNDDVVYCSESRFSFPINYEMPDINNNGVVTIFSISNSRLNAVKALEKLKEVGIDCNLVNVVWLKPTEFDMNSLRMLKSSKFGVVVDSDFTIAGASRSIAYELMIETKVPVFAIGLQDRTAGFSAASDNVTPTAEDIANFIKRQLHETKDFHNLSGHTSR